MEVKMNKEIRNYQESMFMGLKCYNKVVTEVANKI